MISKRQVGIGIILFITFIAITAGSGMADGNFTPANMPPGNGIGAVAGYVGKVVTTDSQPNATVLVVSADNPTQVYASGTSDESGRFHIGNLNATEGKPYKLVAQYPGYGDGYSESFGVGAGSKSMVNVYLVVPPTVTPTPYVSPTPKTGNVSGYITTTGSTAGVSCASVCLQTPFDPDTPARCTYTDTSGHYRFDTVTSGNTMYQINVNKSGYDDVTSEMFLVQTDTDTSKDISLGAGVAAPTTGQPTATTGPSGGNSIPIPGFGLIPCLAAIGAMFAFVKRDKKL
ncbi:MAG TPA: carboxypeptidase-like regulatory domain-containing protein [Methanocella sp.]|nr:carboxypeptidase-like regulatory domain-containing protein [Methanocella sp.]